jgi:S-adenosylmethionine hydrolase
VTWVDHYGNAQLDVDADLLPGDAPVEIDLGEGWRSVPVAAAFAELPAGRPGLVRDSYGMVAICLDRDSAAERLGLRPSSAVRLRGLRPPGPA